MKTKILISLLLIFFITPVHAYKFVIFTDEPDAAVSEKVAKIMKETYPFSKFHVEVEIVKLSPGQMKCKAGIPGSQRAILCDGSQNFQKEAMRMGGDQAMIVSDKDEFAASAPVGQGVPIMSTSAPPDTMLHEYLHTLGMSDEYEYSESEAKIYCGTIATKGENLVAIAPQEPYASDSSARGMHGGEIPWFSEILATTPITSGAALGTPNDHPDYGIARNTSNLPAVLEAANGLYKAKTCNLASPPLALWKPGGRRGVMGKTDEGLGSYMEKLVEKIMISKGAERKMQITEGAEERPRKREEGQLADVRVGDPIFVTPAPVVNDTGRGLFKSIFEWFSDVLTEIGKAFTR